MGAENLKAFESKKMRKRRNPSKIKGFERSRILLSSLMDAEDGT